MKVCPQQKCAYLLTRIGHWPKCVLSRLIYVSIYLLMYLFICSLYSLGTTRQRLAGCSQVTYLLAVRGATAGHRDPRGQHEWISIHK